MPGTVIRRVSIPRTPLRVESQRDAIWGSQAIFGEDLRVDYSTAYGLLYATSLLDGSAGYVSHESIVPVEDLSNPTHRVRVLKTPVRKTSDFKAPVCKPLDLNARCFVKEVQDSFSLVDGAGWVFSADLGPVNEYEDDWVAVAERFIGAPYAWGGRVVDGIDSSGLVQTSMLACGMECPRSCRDIEEKIGTPIDVHISRDQERRRGDLVFWEGHVGIMQSDAHILHATEDFMRVVSEPLSKVVHRRSDVITSTRRLS